MTTTIERKSERITARVAPTALEKIEYAASIQGATVNQFLVSSALETAESIIEHERRITLSKAEAQKFMSILARSPQPNQKLKAAFQSFQEDSLNVERKD
ncbi:DUF1778 domain-containing protein [Amphritea pacifica]|uniref:DUF1778 domain-containing protein n=1 Tax=Amphritea pacifica TaxID=2811233 RepID=A0ABS2W330_9GAMM|nr:DUF1778 domain-containing protein [Amphritea pacifica]MBN0986118.1 DUF1778 domain-containing protein [Amphritea pacifica]MBN1007524.1 DUF1778 domain-containing protein [Amphritea pacifica]